MNIIEAVNLRMTGGRCPTAGSLGECAAISKYHCEGSTAPFYVAHLYLWSAAKDLKPAEVAKWFEDLGMRYVNVHAVLHDPDNNILDGASIDDGVRPWDVTFFLPMNEGVEGQQSCSSPTSS